MTEATKVSTEAEAARDDGVQVLRMPVTADMIASNDRAIVAPDPEQISIIDRIYAFAERLRD